jgi:hypothetical protein
LGVLISNPRLMSVLTVVASLRLIAVK